MTSLKTAKLAAIATVLGVSVTLSGCVTNMYAGGPSPAGGLLTNVTVPALNLTVATDKDSSTRKTGEASARAILGLIATGDASISAAMKNGAISKVHHVDQKVNSVLFGLYLSTTTVVTGE